MSHSVRVVLFFIFYGVPVCQGEDLQRFEYSQPHMGTTFRFVLYASDQATADRAAQAGFLRVAALNRIMSDYLDSSELQQLCARFEKKIADPVPVSRDLFFILKRSIEVSKLSDGAFDVSIRPLVLQWRNARRTQRLPKSDEITSAQKLVGWQKIRLDEKNRSVQLTVPGMQLDLGGIAKGYSADEVLKVFTESGISSALVAAGGDIAVSHAPPGRPGWKIEIAPLPGSKKKRLVLLRDAAISTSGDAEQFVVINGVRYSHLVDPFTGMGLTGRRSVTVIARHGINADSMTKVASILPPKRAIEIFDSQPDLATLIIVKTDQGESETASKQFAKHLLKEEK